MTAGGMPEGLLIAQDLMSASAPVYARNWRLLRAGTAAGTTGGPPYA